MEEIKFKTIKENISAQIIEKKSKFIANIVYIESQEDAEENIKKIKKKYYDAKHNCFAYIVINSDNNVIKKFSDDGEPTGTAGAPILEILEKKDLCNILVVVTRYFGGILLGTGGLLRAYSGATIEALNSAKLIEKTIGYEVVVQTNYNNLEKLKYSIEKTKNNIIKINYGENVELLLEIPENEIDFFLEKNKEIIINRQIKTKKYIDI